MLTPVDEYNAQHRRRRLVVFAALDHLQRVLEAQKPPCPEVEAHIDQNRPAGFAEVFKPRQMLSQRGEAGVYVPCQYLDGAFVGYFAPRPKPLDGVCFEVMPDADGPLPGRAFVGDELFPFVENQ
jgi:hypothetical protein